MPVKATFRAGCTAFGKLNGCFMSDKHVLPQATDASRTGAVVPKEVVVMCPNCLEMYAWRVNEIERLTQRLAAAEALVVPSPCGHEARFIDWENPARPIVCSVCEMYRLQERLEDDRAKEVCGE